jgi:hypothetical protein
MSDRFVYSCVSEDRVDWVRKVRNLVLSVRRFGGSTAHSPIIVNVVRRATPSLWSQLDGMDVELRVVEPFDVRFPHANKLRMLEHPDVLAACDILIGLDCDVIIARDPGGLFRDDVIRAKPEDQTILEDDHWHAIFEEMGVVPPPKDCVMTSSGQVTYPWWNSGVVSIPSYLVPGLREQWGQNVETVASMHDRQLLPANWVTDQIAFVCALHQLRLPFDPLPVTGNFPSCYQVLEEIRLRNPGPAHVIHYHNHHASAGWLRPSGDPVIDSQIDDFNKVLAERVGAEQPALADLGAADGRTGRAFAVQQWLRRFNWYRSPRLRSTKAWLINASSRVRRTSSSSNR